ncbi:NAD(P)/FAD-dependent oxidoreductase [Rhodococcus opacus]|uniref:Putative oxidoreductase n=1 Tax=Rhodococcus opacus (strain B4) TaxID=632772 RepID=C1ASA5_RHOOB|nr:FAD-binding oxidoreductase [Rhodococcus opacus]BAH48354.1 putative oxidoreductase [Rhodococcus opacus B4]
MGKTRVVIVGAGVVGLSAALQLSEAGNYDITVAETDHIGSGSSSRSVGIVETQYIEHFDIEVRAYGHRFIRALAEQSDLQLHMNGYLRLADSDATLGQYELSVARQRECGVGDAQVLDVDDVKALIPFMEMSDRAGALLGASDFYLDGYLFANLMAARARDNGVTVLQRARVLECEWTADGEAELRTERGTLHADLVVNAAGAWAGRVGEILGAPVTLYPELHHAVTVVSKTAAASRIPSVMDYVPGDGAEGVYLRPEGESEFFAGLHSEQASRSAVDLDDVPLSAVDGDFVAALAESFSTRFPGLEDAQLGSGWSGLFPMSFDSRPLVGPHPANEQVICALGSGGNGIQLSPAIGRTVVEYVRGERPSMAAPGSDWDPQRMPANPGDIAGIQQSTPTSGVRE